MDKIILTNKIVPDETRDDGSYFFPVDDTMLPVYKIENNSW